MEEYVAYEETRGVIRLRIIADNDPPNPRKEWDHPGTVMCCDHRRYSLGDENAHSDIADMIRASRDYRPSWDDGDTSYDFSDGPHLWEMVQKCSDIVALPCYLYDHSDITMSTGRFSCPWDSGQVGFIAMGKAAILEAFCKPEGSRLTPALKERAYALLEAEVAEYDQYLTGDVYGCVISRVGGETLDSCWGIFGIEYAKEEGKRVLARAVDENPALAVMANENERVYKCQAQSNCL